MDEAKLNAMMVFTLVVQETARDERRGLIRVKAVTPSYTPGHTEFQFDVSENEARRYYPSKVLRLYLEDEG